MNFPSAILDPNKLSPSPSPSPSPSGKVCIVSLYSNSEGSYYAIFIVDLASQLVVDDDAGYIPTAPTLLIDRCSMGAHDNDHAFCVLKSSLYMFQKGERAFGCLPRQGKSVYTYNLYSHLITGDDDNDQCTVKVLDETMLRPLADMICPKVLTEATPTPDGKRILVFSTMFFYSPNCSLDPDPIDFELYDPPKNKKKKPWKGLPSLQVFLRLTGVPSVVFSITSFAFITNSIFLIQTDKLGIFTVDIDDPSVGWRKQDTFAGSLHIPFGRPFSRHFFVIEGDELCIAGSGAYDISYECSDVFDRSKSFCFPKLSFAYGFSKRDEIFFDNHIIYREGEEEGGKLFGIVRLLMGIKKYTEYAHMRLDVCRFNLDKYRDDKQNVGADARLETSLIKSFKFVLDGAQCYLFAPLCLLPIATYSRREDAK